MRIVVAPDSFKGSLSASAVADAVLEGLTSAMPKVEVITCPMADGGEGTADILINLGGTRVAAATVDIYGRPLTGYWVRYGSIALVEAAVASGFILPEHRIRDGIRTSSEGTGRLIRHALEDPAVNTVFVALGGSGSTDGGMGLAAALGAEFRDGQGRLLEPSGAMLGKVRAVRLPQLAKPVVGLYDVDSALIGPLGAVRMFGPQKGVPVEALDDMDQAMEQFSRVVCREGQTDWAERPGAGAAGGMGFGLLAVGATLRPGGEQVALWTGLDEKIDWAQWVVTGEGRIDAQTARGKVVGIVARHARARSRPVVALVGGRGAGADAMYEQGVHLIYPLVPGPMTLTEAVSRTPELLREAAFHLGCFLRQTTTE